MSQLIDIMAAGLRDSAGDWLASGVVYVYEAGTTTPAVLYESGEDPDGDDPPNTLANPVTLDAGGRKRAWVEGQVKLVIEESDGTAVETLDYIGPDPSTDFVQPPSLEVSPTVTSFTSSGTDWDEVEDVEKIITFEEDCTVICWLEAEAEAAELAVTGGTGVTDAKGYLELRMDGVSEGAREIELDPGTATSANAKRAGVPVSAISWAFEVDAGEHTFTLAAKCPDASRTVVIANCWLKFMIFGQQ
jgi:hypothetical protein